MVVGESNAYSDAYRICFAATFIHVVIGIVVPKFLGASIIWDILGPLSAVCLMMYFIAKDLGDLKKSLIIALVLEGITFGLTLALAVLVFATAVVAA